MKKLYLLFFVMFMGTIHAQEQLGSVESTLPCFETKTLFKSLRETYRESPIIMGKADDGAKSTMSLWMHPVDNTWTIVSTKENLSCVIGVGTNFKLVTQKTNKSV
jgi:hypothetical protein